MTMINIGQHKGQQIHRNDAYKVVVAERGKRSERWQGVDHRELISELDVQLAHRDLGIKREMLVLGDEGQTLYGSLELAGRFEQPEGMALHLAYRHSNISRYALTFYAGAVVLVCSNGMVGFEQFELTRRKHTTGIDVAEVINLGIDNFLLGAEKIPMFQSALTNSPCSDRAAAKFLVEAGRRGILPWSSIGKVDALWTKPTYEDFKPRNRWSLFNAFTEVIRDRAPLQQLPALQGITNLISRPTGVALN
jgi:hypothetical protein